MNIDTNAAFRQAVSHPLRLDTTAHQFAFGSVLWCVFLLVLEPGNLAHAHAAGSPLAWDQEVIRILGASSLGGATTPIQFHLVERFPLSGSRLWTSLAIHLGASFGLAVALISLASMLAPLVLAPDSSWVTRPLTDDLASNASLLMYAMLAMTALIQLLRPRAAEVPRTGTSYLQRITVEDRRGTSIVECARIDWLESQGNYVALHVGAQTHLARETLTRLSARLDPAHFLRIHRRTIVNVARLRSMKALSNGDAIVRLDDGTELRASRSYGRAVRDHFSKLR